MPKTAHLHGLPHLVVRAALASDLAQCANKLGDGRDHTLVDGTRVLCRFIDL